MSDIPRHDSLLDDALDRIDQRAEYDDELVDEREFDEGLEDDADEIYDAGYEAFCQEESEL